MDRGFDTSRPGESFVEVVRGVLVEPARFFAGLGGPRPDRAKGPLVFSIICGATSLPLASIFEPDDPFLPEQPTSPRSVFFSLFEDNPGAALAALFIILLPLLVVLGVYIGAAIQHFFVFLFVRERRGYWGTFPVVAYGCAALSLFLLDPDPRIPGRPLRGLRDHGGPPGDARDEHGTGPAGRARPHTHLLPQRLTNGPATAFVCPKARGGYPY